MFVVLEVLLPKPLKKWVQHRAIDEERSVSYLIENLLLREKERLAPKQACLSGTQVCQQQCCIRSFTPKSKLQRYCSVECRTRAKAARKKRTG
jgi:hypothetical protein